jgi:uncharacterized protein (DUF1330 family)
MSAYVIADVEVTDPAAFAEYAKAGPAIVAAHGGTYLARGGAIETLDGDWAPTRLTIIRFESTAAAKAWIESPEYRPLREIRHKAARSRIVVIDGV